ncbi:hypothetical protein P375_06020 [Gallibacterium genomosp. 2]|uniref:DUF3158 domain-containing protein n=2 Tax=Gallibacterium TaxID=155493 RepID=F4HBY4_GALAU|nr:MULTISPECIES: DUF3158 family protein [Gallibacterium]AEC16411.1 hypothetical protein UMN179_00374 [Gallibacterium anatis UMN179]KGQ32347.1 hypothetical protein P375_06020 [Gallibacterium genomosp. 2]KGQ40181.1 hypothetical protein JP35_03645 [Gallibacterium anatis]
MKYRSLDKEDYKKLVFNTPLNTGLKTLFGPIDNADEYKALAQMIKDARAELFELGRNIVNGAKEYPLNHVPIVFIIDHNSSSGGKFLRWRNQLRNRTGKYAWDQLIQDKNVPEEIKEALIALEKDRIAFNAQMSVMNFIYRQAKECAEKINEIEQLYQQGKNKGKV